MSGAHLKGRTYEEIFGERAQQMREARRNGRWQGGRYSDGKYWYVYSPGHPLAVNDTHVPEHLLVAEGVLNRPLQRANPRSGDAEVVHHLDGDGFDNRPTNLLVCRRRFHTALHQGIRNTLERLHFEGLVGIEFSTEMVKNYLLHFGLDPEKYEFCGF